MMESSPRSHRSTQSAGGSANGHSPAALAPPPLPSTLTPTQKQQRRMTSPALPSTPNSLNPPEPTHDYQTQHQHQSRSSSPLRNGYIPDTSTGIQHDLRSEDGDNPDDSDSDDTDDNDPQEWQRSPSPSSSVSQLAATFAQKVGSFVGGMAPRSPMMSMGTTMPTDAELEAEAERERDRSRREAERILTMEARERKVVEERVLAMMGTARALPPPPSLSAVGGGGSAGGSAPPSPSNSQKESWWTAAKNKLLKEPPLTPAQQVIQDAKLRDKEKEKKGGKGKDKEWPANVERKFSDPAYMNLNLPLVPPARKPVPPSPSSPTPSRPSVSNMPPNLTPSPMRSAGDVSPSREAPPMYAQFNSQGTLDVHGTLLTVVKRFEKLEKWTVGHVRALEERMSDVERWLVDKEKEKEQEREKEKERGGGREERTGGDGDINSLAVARDVREMREEVSELQGRVTELGREMAKLATAPSNLSSGPSRHSAQVSVAPQTSSSIVVHSHAHVVDSPATGSANASPHHSRLVSNTARDTTSTPMSSTRRSSTGTRLPYPTGDYASPSLESGYLPTQAGGTFSPPNSPPSSITSATRGHTLSISGLPGVGLGISRSGSAHSYSNSVTSPPSGTSGLPNTTTSPPSQQGYGLPPPKAKANPQRQSSVSPTPRKRYTVALGGPIVAPPESNGGGSGSSSSNGNGGNYMDGRRTGTPASFGRTQPSIGTAFFSGGDFDESEEERDGGRDRVERGERARDRDEDEFQDETIGKSSGGRFNNGSGGGSYTNANGTRGGDYKSRSGGTGSGSPSPSNPRIRAQSVYGFSSLQLPQTPQTPTAPLRPKVRSKSTDRYGLADGGGSGGGGSGSGGGGVGIGGGKFVDPLVLRKQDKEAVKLAMPRPMGKVPIGQLVAFFDGEKKV